LQEPAFLREDAPKASINATKSTESPADTPTASTTNAPGKASASKPNAPVPETKAEQIPAIVETKIPEYRVIGVLMKTYILVETEDGLVMIDQHAAHERLRYEEYVRALDEDRASQPLLVPQLLRLSPKEMAIAEENMDALRQSGYELEAFGETDLRILAVPMIMGKTDARPLLLRAINALGGMKSMALDARRDEIMQLSCKGAVKAGDALSDSEIAALIAEMLSTDAPASCPHGRPVARMLTKREIEKLFKRIQP